MEFVTDFDVNFSSTILFLDLNLPTAAAVVVVGYYIGDGFDFKLSKLSLYSFSVFRRFQYYIPIRTFNKCISMF